MPLKGAHKINEAFDKAGIYMVQTKNLPDKMFDYLHKNGVKHISTEYPTVGHGYWAESYDNPRLFPWFFSQKKK